MTREQAWAARRPENLTQLAERLGISRAAVSAWTYVPKERLRAVSHILHVKPAELRPDLFPPEPWSAL